MFRCRHCESALVILTPFPLRAAALLLVAATESLTKATGAVLPHDTSLAEDLAAVSHQVDEWINDNIELVESVTATTTH